MYLVKLLLEARPGAPPGVGPDRVAAALRARVIPSDRVEHISVKATGNGMHVGFFGLAGNLAEATANARRVCHRALSTDPVLGGWRLNSELEFME
ncbi:hypothetical protein ACFPIJ_37840 [Dactylosporangium cerinum]|uniref:Uncharacterized protein n=1 Tax=Dactylosporangium cerinum TaxID=1434730 RepID=A0ABV9W8C9_9ACTN